jgi:flagellin-like protein
MIKKGKKAVAPIVTTILLILIVLVLATIIIIWGANFIPEAITKFKTAEGEPEPIEFACERISFQAQIVAEGVSVVNNGNVPIHEFGIKQEGQSRSEIDYFTEDLKSGGSVTLDSSIPEDVRVEIIPVILGRTETGKIQKYSCPEDTYFIIEQ